MASHVALVFPGASYGVNQPLLRYPALVLASYGAELRTVPYPDLTAPDIAQKPDEERWQIFDEAVERSVSELIGSAARVTLLAKSLGTSAIANLQTKILPRDTSAVWITPLFGEEDVAEAAAKKPWRSLYIFGTKDRYHDAAGQASVSRATGGTELPVEGGDHALEVEGDSVATVKALVQITKAVQAFCAAHS